MSSSRSNRSGSRPRLVVGAPPQPPRTAVTDVPWSGEAVETTGPTAPLPSQQVTGQSRVGPDPTAAATPLGSGGEAPAFLYVERGPGAGQLVPLRQGVLIIGRGSEADLRLVHPSISRKHAAITRDGEQFFVRDFGSQNGTFVNQLRSPQEMELFPGDELAVGNAILRLRSRADENDPPRERPFVTGMVMSGPRTGWGFRGLVLAAAISLGLVVALGWALLAGPSQTAIQASPLHANAASASRPTPAAPTGASVTGTEASAPPTDLRAEAGGAMAAPPGASPTEQSTASEETPAPDDAAPVDAAGTALATSEPGAPDESRASAPPPARRPSRGRASSARPAPSGNEAVKASSTSSSADSGRVLAAYEKGDIAGALRLARSAGDRALLRKLEHFQSAYSAGHRSLRARDGIGAIRNFATALKADESISRGWGTYGPELRERLATLYVAAGNQRRRSGDVEGAREAFKAALAYDAKNSAAKQALAQLGRP